MSRRYYVFISGKGPRRAVDVQEAAIDPFGDFVAEVKREFGLLPTELSGIEFRRVQSPPDDDTASEMFEASQSHTVKDNNALSAQGVVYIVGKLAGGE